MPDFLIQYRYYLIAGGIVFVLLLTAIITLVIGIRHARQMKAEPPPAKNPEPKAGPDHAPRIERTKLSIGDMANPWTQGVYERHLPDVKTEPLLPGFAFDTDGKIHRSRNADLAQGVDIEALLRLTSTATGMALSGVYATLVAWHADHPALVPLALKTAGHAHVDERQRQIIRFLFQDITGKPVKPESVPMPSGHENPQYLASLKLYTAHRINGRERAEMIPSLPTEFKGWHEIEFARKLPVRTLYREGLVPVFADALYELNLKTLERYLNPSRYLRIKNSDKGAAFAEWLAKIEPTGETQALLILANPEIFDRTDLAEDKAEKIAQVLDAAPAKKWLFEGGKMPPLTYRLQYFKFFCLFERHNEAVRCFATLGVFRRDRAFRVYYARALFGGGMLHEAWSVMSELMTEYPRDATVLNEAAIYAHKLGRFEEAQQIFGLARGMYPDDATLAYNEAVFTEQYSKIQVEEKWSAVQKMNEWSKPQRAASVPSVD